MGGKGIKTYIKKHIPDGEGIKRVSLSKYHGKTIALDFTNFLYKFLMKVNYVLEFINIIHKFSKYGIKIIFIFDGKPIVEKQNTINKRKNIRDVAKIQYNELCKSIDGDGNEKGGDIDIYGNEDGNGNGNEDGNRDENEDGNRDENGEGEESIETIEARNKKLLQLHKKSISINYENIKICKELFDLMGIEWYHIEFVEADIIFKYLFDIGKIDACYSADMDMLLYKCPILLQDLDFNSNQIYEYKYDEIIKYLNLSDNQLLNACIASGTDFNYPLKKCKIEDNIELIRKYNTIENIINNLETINLYREHKIEVPIDFNYECAIKIYKSYISRKTQLEINNKILFYSKSLYGNSVKANIVSNLKIIIKKYLLTAQIKFVYKIHEFCENIYGFRF